MSGSRLSPPRAERTAARTDAREHRALTLGEIAWLATVPTAIVALLAIAILGPPLGRTLLAPPDVRFWALFEIEVRPEPVEQARFLIALTAPAILACFTFLGARRGPSLPSPVIARLTGAIQLAALAFVVACLLRQDEVLGRLYPPAQFTPKPLDLFSPATFVVAALATSPRTLAQDPLKAVGGEALDMTADQLDVDVVLLQGIGHHSGERLRVGGRGGGLEGAVQDRGSHPEALPSAGERQLRH